MKSFTRLLVAVATVAGLTIGFFLISDTVLGLDFGIIRDTEVSSSVAVLTHMRDVFSLNTVEVVYKVVFPYDFVPGDMNWGLFLKQYRDGRPLSLLEESYIVVYDLCEEIGIALDTREREFVVLTATIMAGFDLAEMAGSEEGSAVSINGSGAAVVTVPPVLITDFILEDANTGTYPYPDIGVGPAGYKKLTTFVRERIAEIAESEGILDLARENGKRFLKQVLLDTGYPAVIFLE